MTRRKSYILTVFLVLISGLGILTGIIALLMQFLLLVSTDKKQDDFGAPSIGKVLYINSYDPGYIISQQQYAGIEDVFKKNHIMYEIEYMDMKNYDTEENYKLFYESFKYKLEKAKNFDVIIVSDDAALSFVEKHQEELIPGIPIVFFGVNDIEHAKKAAENPLITGISEQIFVEDTIEIAIEQNPTLNTIICLYDDSITGRGDLVQFNGSIGEYPNITYKTVSISSMNLFQLGEMLHSLPEGSVILNLSSLQDYAHINDVTTWELVDYIQRNASGIPIYRTNAVGIGAGFIGGKTYNHYNAAVKAGNIVKDIILGKSPADINVEVDIEGQWCFDWQVLKEFQLDPSVLPSGTVFVNKPEEYFDLYGKVLIPFLTISFSLLILLIVAAVNYRKSKNSNGVMMLMNKRMRQTNKELVESKTKLTFIANNDNLTGLPNRAFGEAEIKKIMHSGVPFSLFLMDIDDFKNYNDTYTHACGDFVLQEYGRRLASLTSNNEYFAARYGGDEFILVHKCGHIEKNGTEIEDLKKLLNNPVEFRGITLDMTATLGFADSDPDITYDDLITNADIAMYEAKKNGKSSIVAFSPEMKESMVKRNKIMDILKDECVRGGFEIRYQPQVNAQTGDVYGFEALVRLQNYQVGPADFIPVAEDSGFIAQIGRIVTEKVVSQMDQWRKGGMDLRKVAINYSNGQLVDDEYVPYLKSLLDKYNIPPELIEIEITESLFMGNFDRAKQLFVDLTEIGVGLALDDFGTGYSSLSYLTFVPAQKVKIDKTLVDNYLVDGKESFIQNIVHLVHDLGMKLTVEGVEQKWQYDKLSAMKCDYIQGYFFSKPMTADAVPEFTVNL